MVGDGAVDGHKPYFGPILRFIN